jgi:PhnB protein
MKEIVTYLMFDGNCREAMTFYEKCLGAELYLVPFSEAPGDFPKEAKDRIMHARLKKGDAVLMASDTIPGKPIQQGNNFQVNVGCESLQEIESLFAALGEKGTVKLPLHDAFWGARFGMLTDRFGIHWMFNFELPKQGQADVGIAAITAPCPADRPSTPLRPSAESPCRGRSAPSGSGCDRRSG